MPKQEVGCFYEGFNGDVFSVWFHSWDEALLFYKDNEYWNESHSYDNLNIFSFIEN